MAKLIRAIALLNAIPLYSSMILAATAQEAIPRVTDGICHLYYWSGRLVIDASGQVIPLEEYCQEPVLTLEKLPETQDTGGIAFWQAFLMAASPTAVAFAESAGRDSVIEYGATICPFLREGGTLEQLRQVQTDGNSPPSFEAAVSVAAINTYCPEYRSQIGR